MNLQQCGQALRYLVWGPASQELKRDKLPRDRVEAVAASGKYEGKWDCSNGLIDGAIRVHCLTPQQLESGRAHWKEMRKLTFSTGVCEELLAAYFAILVRKEWKVVLKQSTLDSKVRVACLCAGVVAAVALGALSFYRAYQAHCEKQQWKDSLPGFNAERRRIGQEGFAYLWRTYEFNHDPRGQIVHEDEVKQLWSKTVRDYYKQYQAEKKSLDSIQAKSLWVKRFFLNYPLSQSKLQFTFGESSDFEYLSGRFDELKGRYLSIRDFYLRQRTDVLSVNTENFDKMDIQHSADEKSARGRFGGSGREGQAAFARSQQERSRARHEQEEQIRMSRLKEDVAVADMLSGIETFMQSVVEELSRELKSSARKHGTADFDLIFHSNLGRGDIPSLEELLAQKLRNSSSLSEASTSY